MLKRFVLCLSFTLMACPSPGPMCGQTNEPCCEGTPVCDQGLSCQSSKCQAACGASGQPCCADSVCNEGLFCDNNKCSI
jgi:hypothetical protein